MKKNLQVQNNSQSPLIKWDYIWLHGAPTARADRAGGHGLIKISISSKSEINLNSGTKSRIIPDAPTGLTGVAVEHLSKVPFRRCQNSSMQSAKRKRANERRTARAKVVCCCTICAGMKIRMRSTAELHEHVFPGVGIEPDPELVQ